MAISGTLIRVLLSLPLVPKYDIVYFLWYHNSRVKPNIDTDYI